VLQSPSPVDTSKVQEEKDRPEKEEQNQVQPKGHNISAIECTMKHVGSVCQSKDIG
jgi:hypothetical protein